MQYSKPSCFDHCFFLFKYGLHWLFSLSASICDWTQWYDDEADLNNTMSVTYERELLHELRALHTELCSEPRDIQCLVKASNVSFDETGENATCLPNVGLRCMALGEGECSDYIVRFLCCRSTIAIVTKISTVVPTLPGSSE